MTELESLIGASIDAAGPLAFGRYMDLALYHPELGFYATGGAGRRRDFITSAEVGPLFGRLVAGAADRCWRELGEPDEFAFVEVGAGAGTLARSILRVELDCAAALRYVAVESTAQQRARHPDGVESMDTVPSFDAGMIFANELLDNLAFDLYERVEGGWDELRVARAGDGLALERGVCVEQRRWADTPIGTRVPDQNGARRWLAEARAHVGHGRVVCVDYMVPGYPVEPDREWLRTYRGHARGGDPLQDTGRQDITADVSIEQLASVAEPDVSVSQADWLRGLDIEDLVEQGRRYWAAHAAAPDLAAMEMRSRITESAALLDPAGLGGFHVLEWRI